MRKILVALFVGLMWKVAVEAAIELPEHLKGPAKILRQTCQAETNVSDDLIACSINGYLPEDKALQCYIDCLLRTVGLYDAAGNIKFDDVAHLIPSAIKEKLDIVTAACKTIHGSNKCETAWLTLKCYFQADPEVTLSPGNLHCLSQSCTFCMGSYPGVTAIVDYTWGQSYLWQNSMLP